MNINGLKSLLYIDCCAGPIKMVALVEQRLSVCTVDYRGKRRFLKADCKVLVDQFALLSAIDCE
jgi:hypothetical protein